MFDRFTHTNSLRRSRCSISSLFHFLFGFPFFSPFYQLLPIVIRLSSTATIIMSIVISSDVPFTAVPVGAGVADAQSTPPVEVKDDELIPAAASNQQVQPCPSTVAELKADYPALNLVLGSVCPVPGCGVLLAYHLREHQRVASPVRSDATFGPTMANHLSATKLADRLQKVCTLLPDYNRDTGPRTWLSSLEMLMPTLASDLPQDK